LVGRNPLRTRGEVIEPLRNVIGARVVRVTFHCIFGFVAEPKAPRLQPRNARIILK
jgi:hypothetical protein